MVEGYRGLGNFPVDIDPVKAVLVDQCQDVLGQGNRQVSRSDRIKVGGDKGVPSSQGTVRVHRDKGINHMGQAVEVDQVGPVVQATK